MHQGKTTPLGYKLQDKLVASQIADEYVKAYLVHPERFFLDIQDGYRNRWDSIKQTVGQIIPALADPDRWKEIVYDRLPRRSPLLRSTAAGKVLFKYDPDHEGHRRAVLWVEDRLEPYNDDTW